jgi:hypothetical protein
MEQLLSLTMNQMMFGKRGWSKWGGSPKGLTANLDDGLWYCQVCGDEQRIELPVYIEPYDETYSELMKVCSFCRHEMIVRKVRKVFDMLG